MSDERANKKMPKGGKKGGSQFPQLGLAEAASFTKKLVAKTHNGPVPAAIVLPGAFGSNGPTGQVRASALKQYGLMAGDTKGYEATQLGKDLDSAPPDEKKPHLRAAFLNAKVFRALFDTFSGDTVSVGKIRQQLSVLRVHPENVEKATSFFIEGAQSASLGQLEGENLTLVRSDFVRSELDQGSTDEDKSEATTSRIQSDESIGISQSEVKDKVKDTSPRADEVESDDSPTRPVRAVINVSVSLDSSLDTDKLEKQLELLRKFGAL